VLIDEGKLKHVLVGLRSEYKRDWIKDRNKIFENLEEASRLLLKDELNEDDVQRIRALVEDIYCKRITWGTPDMYTREDLRNLLEFAQKIEKSNFDYMFPKVVEALEAVRIEGVKLATLSTLMSIVNPKAILPACQGVLGKELQTYFGFEPFWGGNTDYSKYSIFIKTIRKVSQELGIEDMAEVTYYLKHFSSSSFRKLNRNCDEVCIDVGGENILEILNSLLKNKKQAILYGPPGTGKTWLARRYVSKYAGGRYEFMTFHPSYSYEEFVEGLRPVPVDGGLNFVIEDGIFKRLVIRALCEALIPAEDDISKTAEELLELLDKIEQGYNVYCDYSRKKRELWNQILKMDRKDLKSLFENSASFYLVIDEINRGDVSRIFGELITLLESDKRLGEKYQLVVTLPYSKEPFCVPPNLFILATMNTADRSIALIDVALRRRFGFVEVMPDYSILEKELLSEEMPEDIRKIRKLAVDALRAINEKVRELYDRDHQIGHSYLLRLKTADDATKTLKEIWYHEIIPLLQEYFYDSPDKLEDVLKSFVKVEKNNYEIVYDLDFLKALEELTKELG